MSIYFTDTNGDVQSLHSQGLIVAEDSYSNILEITKITTASRIKCQATCVQSFGCTFYNFNKKLSACHIADPQRGSMTEKPGDLVHWKLYKIEQLSLNGHDEF